jgi:hypothetical protein
VSVFILGDDVDQGSGSAVALSAVLAGSAVYCQLYWQALQCTVSCTVRLRSVLSAVLIRCGGARVLGLRSCTVSCTGGLRSVLSAVLIRCGGAGALQFITPALQFIV